MSDSIADGNHFTGSMHLDVHTPTPVLRSSGFTQFWMFCDLEPKVEGGLFLWSPDHFRSDLLRASVLSSHIHSLAQTSSMRLATEAKCVIMQHNNRV